MGLEEITLLHQLRRERLG